MTDVVIDDAAGGFAEPRLAISPSALSPEQMTGLLDTEVDLDLARRTADQARWKNLVTENAPLRVIGGDGTLVSAPIIYFDPLLLSCATIEWQKMARVIGEALASFGDDGVHQTGDLVLNGRAIALAESGALEWRGDLSSMQGCEVRLPASA